MGQTYPFNVYTGIDQLLPMTSFRVQGSWALGGKLNTSDPSDQKVNKAEEQTYFCLRFGQRAS
jgi:hypothetical protein